jgi:hypothetical protein
MLLLARLKDALDWIEKYKSKEPLLRYREEKEIHRQKSAESANISRQLSQHALILRNQVACLLTDIMEAMEIAMDKDPNNKEKYQEPVNLRKSI